MPSSFASAQRRSKVRWYFGVVGLLGLVATWAELSRGNADLSIKLLFGLGAPLFVAYLAAAVAFNRLLGGPWLRRLAATMALWATALTIRAGVMDAPTSAIPIVLFVLIPAVSASWAADDLP